MSEHRAARYLELMIIVQAIQEAAAGIITGEGKFSRTSDSVKKLNAMLFPETQEEILEKAKRSQKLLEREFSQGPLKVQRLDYGEGKRGKKRR